MLTWNRVGLGFLVVSVVLLVIVCRSLDRNVHVSLAAGSTGVVGSDEITILSFLDDPPEGTERPGRGLDFWGVEVRHVFNGTYGGCCCWGLRTTSSFGAPERPIMGEELVPRPHRGQVRTYVLGFFIPTGDDIESLIFDRSCFQPRGILSPGVSSRVLYFDAE